MNATIEERIRVVLDAQAAAVNITEILPEVTELDEVRNRRPSRGPIIGLTIATAAAVVAGVVFVRSDERVDQIVTATSWGYPVQMPEGMLRQFELAKAPDGFVKRDRADLPTELTDTYNGVVCTRWSVSNGIVQCAAVQGVATTWYFGAENEFIAILTANVTDATRDDLAQHSPDVTRTKVRGHEAWIDASMISWLEDDDTYVMVSSALVDLAASELVALAEGAREVDKPNVTVGLQFGSVEFDDEGGDGEPLRFGAGGTADEPCIVTGFGGCEPVQPQDGKLYALSEEWLDDGDIPVVAGSVVAEIESVRVRRGDETVMTETVALPGQALRFWVVEPPNDDGSDLIVEFLDGSGKVRATYTE